MISRWSFWCSYYLFWHDLGRIAFWSQSKDGQQEIWFLTPFKSNPTTKIKTPIMCSGVQSLLNIAKLKKIVAAFLVVVVIDIVKAPNRFVIAAAHDPPKIPSVEKRKTAIHLFFLLHEYWLSPIPSDIYSLYVPSDKKKKSIPLHNSLDW